MPWCGAVTVLATGIWWVLCCGWFGDCDVEVPSLSFHEFIPPGCMGPGQGETGLRSENHCGDVISERLWVI